MKAIVPILIVAIGGFLVWRAGDDTAAALPSGAVVAPVTDEWGFATWVPEALDGDPKRAMLIREAAFVVADAIETDGKMPSPRLADTAQVASFWADSLDYATRAQGAVTEEFGRQLEAAANSPEGLTPGGEGADLTPALRTKAASFFRALGQAIK
jgi:hypothetical protein